MQSSFWFDAINLGCSLVVVEDCFVIENSVDPGSMPHYVIFHLGLYCLPKKVFTMVGQKKVRG